MGLFEKVFGKPKKVQTNGYFKMLDGYTPMYTSYRGSIYEMLQTKATINTIASDCGKSVPELAKHNARYEYILKHQPNPYMSSSEFIERVVTNYLCDNNSFIIPTYDKYGRVTGLFPLSFSQVEAVDVNGELYLQYRFMDGEMTAIEYSKIGHLRRMQYKSDLFGDDNGALNPTLGVVNAQNQSVINALNQSGAIRFMAKIAGQLIDEDDFKQERQSFSNLNFSHDNNQMMIYDSRYSEIKQIESTPVYLDEKQQTLIDENIQKYFGISKNAIMHQFANDYEWNSYYEGVLEPILIKLGEALTKIMYTPNQVMNGNGIYITTNRLQYMDNATKLNYATQLIDRGVINGDMACDILQLPHHEGGDKYYIRKEYAEVTELDKGNKEEVVDEVQLLPVEGEEDEN